MLRQLKSHGYIPLKLFMLQLSAQIFVEKRATQTGKCIPTKLFNQFIKPSIAYTVTRRHLIVFCASMN